MNSAKEQLEAAGNRVIENESTTGSLIPLSQEGVVFKQMFEYPVRQFVAEVGFYADVLGFTPIALTEDYALFTHPEHGYCMSFRLDVSAPNQSDTGLKLLFMTRDIPAADAHLEQTGLVPERLIHNGSSVQEVISFSTPNGVRIEIWEDPSAIS